MTTSTKFKVQGVGLDTSNMIIKPWVDPEDEYSFDYFHTSISANNDFLISEFIKSFPGGSLITSIDFLDNPERTLLGHLLELGRKKVDLLLVDSEVILKNLGTVKETIKQLREYKIIEEFGVKNPKTAEDLKAIEEAIEEKIKFVSLDLCPLNFNYDIVNYCKENTIDLLGFNPFGGYINSASVISSFTIPYLLGFSGNYCSVIFLSGRDLILSKESMLYIKDNIIGSECSSKFSLKKNVSRLHKPLKKVVDTSLIFNKNLVLSVDSPEYLFPLEDININLGSPVNIVDGIDPKLRTELEMFVDDLLEVTEFPKDATLQSKYAVVRYQVLSALRIKFPETDGWNIHVVNTGKLVSGILVHREIEEKKKGFFKKKKNSQKIESKHFLCALPKIDLPVFIEEPDDKNTVLENSNPNN